MNPSAASPHRHGIASLTAVGALVFIDLLFGTLLPVSLVGGGVSSGFIVGLVLGVLQGVGVLVLLPALRVTRPNRPGSVTLFWALALAGGSAVLGAMVFAMRLDLLAAVLLGAALVGIGRTVLLVRALAAVSSLPNQNRTQSGNAISQRLGSVAAALVSAAFIASSVVDLFYGVVVVIAGVVLLLLVGRSREFERDLASGPSFTARTAVAHLRGSRDLQNSSLVNAMLRVLWIVGASFVPLLLVLEEGAAASGTILLFLMIRDGFGVLVAICFPAIILRLGSAHSVLVAGVLAATGLSLLLIGLDSPLILFLSAMLQGAAGAVCIALTNILATRGGQGRAFRLAVTQFVPSLVGLIVPGMFGALLDRFGTQWMLVAAASLILLIAVVIMSRDQGSSAVESSG